jgi:hypothetical protein
VRKALTEKEQKEYLCSKIDEPVVFNYPETGHLRGTLKDRIVFKGREDNLVTYWNMIDWIGFEGREDRIRITYYRYKNKEKRWNFAGQTSITLPKSRFRDLFIKAIREKEWIREIFREVFKQCAKELE